MKRILLECWSKCKTVILSPTRSKYLLRSPLIFFSATHLSPLKLTVDPAGVWKLEARRGHGMAISVAIHGAYALRAACLIWRLPLLVCGVTLATQAGFTIDACLGTLATLTQSLAFISLLILHVQAREVTEMFNFSCQISKNLAKKFHGSRWDLLEVHTNEVLIVAFSTAVVLAFVVVPTSALYIVMWGRFSPFCLVHELAMETETGYSKFDLTNPLLLILGLVDWAFIMKTYFLLLLLSCLGFEAMVQTTLALRTLR